jgi:cell division protein FtsQ
VTDKARGWPRRGGAGGASSGRASSGRASSGRAGSARASTPKRGHDLWRTAFFAVLVLAILGGSAWALLGSSLLVVRHEHVSGNRLVPTAKILAAADIRTGTPLATVDTAAAADRVERITQVFTATVGRSWPDTIVITVRERTPQLAVASGTGFELIDAYGVAIEFTQWRPAGLVLLSSPPTPLRDDPGVLAAVSVLRHAMMAEKAAELAVLMRSPGRYYDVSDPATAVTG